MPVPPEVIEWRERAEVDHIGPFVKAWAAFNAWYRHVSGSRTDRDGILFIRTRPNSVRSAILPILDPLTADTPEALKFKGHVAGLHGALEAYRLESTYSGRVEHVSFRSVPIGNPNQPSRSITYSGVTYRVVKANGQWTSNVTNRAGVETARITQADYNLQELLSDPTYQALPMTGKGQLRAVYVECDPRPMSNLLAGTEAETLIGSVSFPCTCEDLFAGIIVTIYRMRNLLLHGELAPNQLALAPYEHAYQIVRWMVQECR